MFSPARFDLLKLDQIIDSYDYDTDEVLQEQFRPIENALWVLMEHYGEGVNGFGVQMTEHLRRTSLDGMKFLTEELGFTARAGRNFQTANLFHDLGKIHKAYDPSIWALPHRPTDIERAEKNKHAARGPDVFLSALKNAPPGLLAHPHVSTVIPALMMFHHERVDGTGFFGKRGDELGLVIKTICIADAKDGDMIQRGHQEFRRSEQETLDRLKSGAKYTGAFDSLLDKYIAYRHNINKQ